MITQLKKALYVSTSILLTGGLAFNCAAETSTAASLVGNLLTTAAGVVTQSPAPAQEVTSPEGESALPTVEDLLKDETTPDQQLTATSSEVAEQDQTNIVATEEKKIGFVDQEGNILIPPEGTAFPGEMQDGKIYFFSRDVDTLKQTIADGKQTSLFPPLANTEGSIPGQNGQMMNQTNPANPQAMTPQGSIPGQNGQMMNQTNPANPQAIPSQGIVPGQNGQMMNQTNPATPQVMTPQGSIPGQNGQMMNQTNPANTQAMTSQGSIPGQETSEKDASKKPIMFQCYLA